MTNILCIRCIFYRLFTITPIGIELGLHPSLPLVTLILFFLFPLNKNVFKELNGEKGISRATAVTHQLPMYNFMRGYPFYLFLYPSVLCIQCYMCKWYIYTIHVGMGAVYVYMFIFMHVDMLSFTSAA